MRKKMYNYAKVAGEPRYNGGPSDAHLDMLSKMALKQKIRREKWAKVDWSKIKSNLQRKGKI